MHGYSERRASGRIDRLVPLFLAETDAIARDKTVAVRKQKAAYRSTMACRKRPLQSEVSSKGLS